MPYCITDAAAKDIPRVQADGRSKSAGFRLAATEHWLTLCATQNSDSCDLTNRSVFQKRRAYDVVAVEMIIKLRSR